MCRCMVLRFSTILLCCLISLPVKHFKISSIIFNFLFRLIPQVIRRLIVSFITPLHYLLMDYRFAPLVSGMDQGDRSDGVSMVIDLRMQI